MKIRWFNCLAILCSLLAGAVPFRANGQSCEQELANLQAKITKLNADFEKTKADMAAGLFCSVCGKSRTELDKSGGFENHLAEDPSKRKAVAATWDQNQAAYKRYLSEFNSTKADIESKAKSCASARDQASRDQYERTTKEAQQKQEANANFQLEQQREAKRQADAQREANAEAARNLAAAQRLEQDRLNALHQESVNNFNKSTTNALQIIQGAGDRIVRSLGSSTALAPGNVIRFEDSANAQLAPMPAMPSLDEIGIEENSTEPAQDNDRSFRDNLYSEAAPAENEGTHEMTVGNYVWAAKTLAKETAQDIKETLYFITHSATIYGKYQARQLIEKEVSDTKDMARLVNPDMVEFYDQAKRMHENGKFIIQTRAEYNGLFAKQFEHYDNPEDESNSNKEFLDTQKSFYYRMPQLKSTVKKAFDAYFNRLEQQTHGQ